VSDTDSTVTSKVCITCQEEKLSSAFRNNRRQCRKCSEAKRAYTPEILARRNQQKKDRRANASAEERAKSAARMKNYVAKNAEAVSAYKKQYALENKEQLSAGYADWYAKPENKAAAQERSRQWRKQNPELKAEANKRWAEANKDVMLGYFRKSKEIRRRNPAHRLYNSIGSQIRQAMMRSKDGKPWELIVGYTRNDLIEHLERQFSQGMNWANYGKVWHVDHIVPQVAFESLDVDIQSVRSCWGLANLRPLLARDNLSKGAKLTHLV
jgi:hypothetical protein